MFSLSSLCVSVCVYYCSLFFSNSQVVLLFGTVRLNGDEDTKVEFLLLISIIIIYYFIFS